MIKINEKHWLIFIFALALSKNFYFSIKEVLILNFSDLLMSFEQKKRDITFVKL